MNNVRSRLLQSYIFFLFLILPLDWFAPSGKLLREFGAKPAIPLLVLGSIVMVLFKPASLLRPGKLTYQAGLLLGIIFSLGSAAFWINLVFSWSDFGRSKDPVVQYAAQGALFLTFALTMVIHADIFKDRRWRVYVLSILPAIIMIHLLIFSLDATSVVSHAEGWLSLFRSEGTAALDRPSGLMSEPSYFGTFAAMYGFPLLTVKMDSKAWLRWLLAGSLFAAAVLTRAKTFVPVLLSECLVLAWQRGRAVIRLKYILLLAALLAASAYLVISNATFDMQENLSSVARLGSTELSLNVARAGYGLTGIGFGQFHFFYRPKFAPNFIFASQEALDQMTGSIESRASTYNLYTRLLVETGILGLILFVLLLAKVFRALKSNRQPTTLFSLLFVAASLGFLFTQDTYCYPPLIVGLAMALGCAADSSNTLPPAEQGRTWGE